MVTWVRDGCIGEVEIGHLLLKEKVVEVLVWAHLIMSIRGICFLVK